MKLRNKKTGEVAEVSSCNNASGKIRIYYDKEDGKIGTSDSFSSLAELNEWWEDYKPAEPLIKDEKIRKAVRIWAEANNRDVFKVMNEHFNCCKIIGFTDGGIPSCDKIGFGTTIAGADKDHYYTITELCGEEENV